MEEVINTTKTAKPLINNYKHIPYACNLRAIRTSLGITQSDLARLIGKTSEFVNMIEREKYYPILETRIKIAKALKTDTSAIWIENKNLDEVKNETKNN